MLLRKSLEKRGNNVNPSGRLAEFLSEYAGLLAAQGALDTALEYIGPTDDSQLEDLRERLYYALGHKSQQQATNKPIIFTSPPYDQIMPPYGQQPVVQQPSPMQFNPSNFNTNALNVPTSAPYQQPMMGQPQAQPFMTTVLWNNYMPGVPPIEITPLTPPPQQMKRNPTPPPGWNDPPALMSTRNQKKNETLPPPTSATPITHPLFGVDPNQNQNGYYDPNQQYQKQCPV
uniref:Uncharacterized protein n=1 Tax=Megaselia scalaris TaxID=36166 RepID=T1GGI4_MEGSC